MTILDEIINHQKLILGDIKKELSIDQMLENPAFNRPCVSSKEKFESNSPGVIAEFKRRSPSRPAINLDAVSTQIVPAYQSAGANVCSILTNEKYFGGSNLDLTSVRSLVNIPLLRKDFIVDEYQVYETKYLGADLILLIAAALSPYEVLQFARVARDLGLEVLLEINSEAELDYINPYIDMVGVNNRNLKNFTVDPGLSEFLGPKIPNELIKISESGISSSTTARSLTSYGFQGFLIGDYFMSSPDPGEMCRNFIHEIKIEDYAD